jgi:PAS domain-containing protein
LAARITSPSCGEERVTVLLAADIVMLEGEACILSAVTDITDRVRAEEALRESEQRFIHLFHANPLPMSITSLRDHRHLEVNEAAVHHSGYSREELPPSCCGCFADRWPGAAGCLS